MKSVSSVRIGSTTSAISASGEVASVMATMRARYCLTMRAAPRISGVRARGRQDQHRVALVQRGATMRSSTASV